MKTKILVSTLVFCFLLLGDNVVVRAEESSPPPTNGSHLSQNLPYKSVEDAVRASGGTYGVIDTSNPDAGNNFVQTIFDQGLTANDGNGECTSMNIRSGITFSCALGKKVGAYYYYEGKKGEKVVVTVSTKDFTPEIDILDANGDVEYSDNKQKKESFTITKTFLYTGRYTFEVRTRYYDEIKASGSFTIGLTSDKSNIQPDIRRDSLIEGKKYSIYELNQNQSKTARKFLVDAYVISIYKAPECPPNAYSCPISLPPNITIGDICTIAKTINACNSKKSDAILGISKAINYNFKTFTKQPYQFEVSVQNSSNTNIPSNEFRLISIKNAVNGNTTKENNLIEGKTYSVKQLSTNTSTIPRKFFTEAYVVYIYKAQSGIKEMPYIVVSDDKSYEVNFPSCAIGTPCPPGLGNEQLRLNLEDREGYNFELKKKYQFEIIVQNNSNTNIHQNDFRLISIKSANNSFTSRAPLPTIQTTISNSIFSRFENWFRNLFK